MTCSKTVVLLNMRILQLIVYGLFVELPFLAAAGLLYMAMTWRDIACQWDWADKADDDYSRVLFPKG